MAIRGEERGTLAFLLRRISSIGEQALFKVSGSESSR